MFNGRYLKFLEWEVQSLKESLSLLREEYEGKLEAERQRSRVMEQMFLDRLLVQRGLPQMYDTVPVYEHTTEAEPESQGYPPGTASILAMQQFEDSLFAKMQQQAQELAQQQRQEAEVSFLPE